MMTDVCVYPLCLQAKAFALLSEEGIAKGVRRIVAVTAADAAAAIAEGEKLAAEVEQAAALPDAELEQVGLAGADFTRHITLLCAAVTPLVLS
jgi:alanyl-tRNA synthetase